MEDNEVSFLEGTGTHLPLVVKHSNVQQSTSLLRSHIHTSFKDWFTMWFDRQVRPSLCLIICLIIQKKAPILSRGTVSRATKSLWCGTSSHWLP